MEAYPTFVPAVVLAGGLSRRMGGGDKPLLTLDDAGTLLDHLLARLRPQAAPLLLNANGDPARFARFGLPVLPDTVAGWPGPLAGILAGLEWAAAHGFPRILSVPGDTPFLPSDLVARLSRSAAAVPCAASAGRRHPAVALWPSSLAGALRAALASGQRRVEAFAAAHGAAPVEWDAVPADPFLNVNTRDDLSAARHAVLAAAPAAR